MYDCMFNSQNTFEIHTNLVDEMQRQRNIEATRRRWPNLPRGSASNTRYNSCRVSLVRSLLQEGTVTILERRYKQYIMCYISRRATSKCYFVEGQ